MNQAQLAAQRAMLLADGYSVPSVGELGAGPLYLEAVSAAPLRRPAPTITPGLLAVEAVVGPEVVGLTAGDRAANIPYLSDKWSRIGDGERREAVGHARRELSWLALQEPDRSFSTREQMRHLGIPTHTPEVNKRFSLVRSWLLYRLRIAGYPLILVERGDIQANPQLNLTVTRLAEYP